MLAYFLVDRYGGGYRARSIAPLKRELRSDVPAALTKAFSLQETTEYLRIFSFLDISYKGSLSKDDISKVVASITGRKLTGQDLSTIFRDAKNALETFVEAQNIQDEKRGKAFLDAKKKRRGWFGGDRLSLGEFLGLMHRIFHLGLDSPLKDPVEQVGAKVNVVRGQILFYLILVLTFLVLVGTSTTLFHYFKVLRQYTLVLVKRRSPPCAFVIASATNFPRLTTAQSGICIRTTRWTAIDRATRPSCPMLFCALSFTLSASQFCTPHCSGSTGQL